MRRWLLLLVAALALFACDKVNETDYDAPNNVSVSKVDDGRLRITWEYNTNYEDIVYEVARKEGEASWNESYYETSDDSDEFIDEATTDGNTLYAYKVRARNTEDNTLSTWSLPVAWFSPFTPPTDLELVQSAQDVITLSWTDNCVGEEGYKIDRRIDGGNWQVSHKKLAANTVTWIDSVDYGVSISYRVYAYFGDTRSQYLEDNVTSSFPAPTNLDAQQTSQQQIRVKWDNNSEMQDGYQVERRVGSANFEQVSSVADTVLVDYMDISAGTVAYRVRAFAEREGEETLYSAYSTIDTVQFNIVTRGAADLPDSGADVFVDGADCFVANEYSGLQVIDAANENAPYILYSILLEGRTKAVVAQDELLFATNQSGGFHIISIADPTTPLQYGYCETIAVPYDVEVDLYGSYPYAWVADGQAGVLTIALGGDNPANPRVIDRLNTFGVCYALERDGDILYLADGAEGVKKIDISDPTAPIVVDAIDLAGEARNLRLKDGKLYVAAGEAGLIVLNAASMSIMHTVSTGGFANDVDVLGSYALLADRDHGLVAVDMTADSGPSIAAQVDAIGAGQSIMIQNNYAYITTENKLLIVQFGP